jgi:hypothetical protein
MGYQHKLMNFTARAVATAQHLVFLALTVAAAIAGFHFFTLLIPESAIPGGVLDLNHTRVWTAIALFFIIPRLFDILSDRDFKQDRGRLANDPVALAIYFSFRMLSVAILLGWLFS